MIHPQISVIVPVYNTSLYLRQCMDTLVNQSFRDIEIICVNDGSTDDSREILEEFSSGDERMTVINRPEASKSAALPRNIGLEKAHGKYVMFLDSDDYFDASMFEKMYACAEENQSDLVMCDNYRVSFDTGEISMVNTELHANYIPGLKTFSYEDVPETIFQISNAAVWHKLILRETLRRYDLKFQLDTPILDDIYFVNLLLVLSKRISVIRDRLIFYRLNRHGGQTTKIEEHKESIFKAFHALNGYLMEHSIYDRVQFSLQNWTLSAMAWWLRSVGDYGVFCELYGLYKNEYFKKLNLMGLDPGSLYDGIGGFYNSVLGGELEPTLNMVLDSILRPGSRVAIYGAGLVGRSTYEIVTTQGRHQIVLWCDKNAGKFNNSLISPPEKLLSCAFDALFIAIADYDIVNEVKAFLAGQGIDSKKVYTV